MNTLVSIIIPVHNCEKYIGECINSIINQTYNNIEIIIVDAKSDDNTLSEVKKFNDTRIKLIKLVSNVGLSEAFQIGFINSKGNFIVRNDPDDISTENRIAEQVSYLQNDNSKLMVSCLIKCISEDEKFNKLCERIQNIQNAYKDQLEIEKAIISDFIPVFFPTVMFRRELYTKANINCNSHKFNDQIDLFLNFLKISSLEKIQKELYIYRRHNNAYHIQYNNEYNKYILDCLNKSGIKDFLEARKLRDNKRLHDIKINSDKDYSNIRVLLLVDTLDIGGTETHVLSLAKELNKRGIHVVVGTSGGPLRYMFDKYGIKVVNIPITHNNLNTKKSYGSIGEINKLICKENINIVHSHLFASMKIGAEIYKNYKIPHIITLHGLYYNDEIIWTTCIDATKIITVSKPVKNMVVGKFGGNIKNKLVIIPNGVDNDQFTVINDRKRIELGISEDAIVAVYCSRLSKNKAIAAKVFLRSCYGIGKEYNNFKGIIIGDGHEKWTILNEANQKNCNLGRDLLSVIGFKLNVKDYYNIADIVVGTGRVAIEAMACSKPVIGLGDKGCSGLVCSQTKERQMLEYFGDHAARYGFSNNKVVKELKYLIDNPGLRKELGEWGRKWCLENYNIQNVANRIIEIYNSSINA
ncbi:glycosyltransferase [Abyssisolibacter fermentans]|uniref:glycosyltransferase n=1 Tax=Abyssisolibacter fermentans TaxID=1766203 RepID=UPI0008312F90|nr:glycosyltransferase [Abyssisolibacter fermentans]